MRRRFALKIQCQSCATSRCEPVPLPRLQCLAGFIDKSVKGPNVAGIEAKSRCLPPHGFGFANKALGFLLIRAIGKQDIDAPPREVDGGVAAKAAASTCDDGDLIRHSLNSLAEMRFLDGSGSSGITGVFEIAEVGGLFEFHPMYRSSHV